MELYFCLCESAAAVPDCWGRGVAQADTASTLPSPAGVAGSED